MSNNPKKIILCLVDGIGVSSSWSGNAFSQKDDFIFTRLFKEYPSELLKTDLPGITQIGLATNPQSSYATIFSGRKVLPFFDYINKTINEHRFSNQKTFHQLFESPQKPFASLHMLGTLSKDEYHGSKNHLLEILKISRNRKVFNIYIHLFLDNSYQNRSELVNDLQEIENIARSSAIGKVVSLIGSDSLGTDSNRPRLSSVVDCLIGGKGSRALSFDQIINTYPKPKNLSALSPTTIMENDCPLGRIGDFDTLLFFDHNISALNHLLNILTISSKLPFRKIPRSMKIFTLTPSLFKEYAVPIFDNPNLEPFFSILPEKNRLLFMYDDKQIDYFNILNNQRNCKEVVFSLPSDNFDYGQIYRQILNRLTESFNLYDIIILSAPNIDRAAKFGDLNSTLKAINTFNFFLTNMEKLVLKNDLVLFLTSNFGRAENLNDKREDLVLPSFNPVPFTVISNYKTTQFSPKTRSNDELISNILTLKHTTADIAPTILQVLGLPKTPDMEGGSLF